MFGFLNCALKVTQKPNSCLKKELSDKLVIGVADSWALSIPDFGFLLISDITHQLS